jgi:C-terminal processing protease CtpA/Prc
MEVLRYFTLTVDPEQHKIWLDPTAGAKTATFGPTASGFTVRIDASHTVSIREDLFKRDIAGEAGLRPGDEILSIDDRPASEFSYYEARDHFRRAGQQLKLRCRRDGREFEVQYEMRFPYQYPPQWPPEKEEFDPNAVPSDEN